jgi:glycosyltransferase involved in cell wall biosynthesis
MSAADIAIVIPTHNRRDVLSAAVDSVLAQDHENLELIVVDDCSTDDTPAYLNSIADSRLRWHRFAERRKGNAARNHGVRLSQAPIVSFLDSDDVYQPHRIGDVAALFAEAPAVDVHISSFVSVTRSGTTSCVNPDAVFAPGKFESYLLGGCLSLAGSGISVRRRAFDEIGGFDEGLLRMQDLDLLLRLARSHRGASTSKVNWVKNRSSDSISRQPQGQIAALDALCARHPVIEDRYPELLGYLVAREIVRPFVNFRFREALRALGEANRYARSSLRSHQVATRYVSGKRLRRKLTGELSRRSTIGREPAESTGTESTSA